MSEQDVKKMYQEMKAPDKAVQQLLKIPDQQGRGPRRGVFLGRLAAACLAVVVVIPTGAFAAGKITQYFQSQMTRNNYQVKFNIQQPDKTAEAKPRHVKMNCNFGAEYSIEQKGSMQCLHHKDGFNVGKDFWYRLIYIDNKKDTVLPAYNIGSMIKNTIDGHEMVYYQVNTVVGSVYASDYDTDYNQHLFVFYEELGYIVEFGGMQKLGAQGMFALAKKAKLQETEKENAESYITLSAYQKNPTAEKLPTGDVAEDEQVKWPVGSMNTDVKYGDFTLRVTDVNITDSIKGLHANGFDDAQTLPSLCDKNGTLKSYTRENLQFGDGITAPERSVASREKIQPKLVCVTMKVKMNHNVEDGGHSFMLPALEFLKQKKGKYYTSMDCSYDNAKRPEEIEYAFIDSMPCYFEETKGGKNFWRIDGMKAGEERTLHFAYLVDEDMIENGYLIDMEGLQQNNDSDKDLNSDLQYIQLDSK